ncbi:MAG: hypothetical protein WC637_00505 [Victivallales bacterium]|jgi:hypothetical protein
MHTHIIGLIIMAIFLIGVIAVLQNPKLRYAAKWKLLSQRGALTADKKIEYTEGVEAPFDVINADIIYGGSHVCVNAAGYALPGSDTAGLIYVGEAMERVDNSLGAAGDKKVIVRRRGLIRMEFATAISIANVGDNVFIYDDEKVDVTANVTNDIFCGIIASYIDTTHAWVDIEPAITQAEVATHIADTSAAHSASAISIADAGLFTSQTEVEAALQEIYQDLESSQGIIPIPTPYFSAAGVALAAFADGASDVPGFCVTSKGMGVRWNNHAAPLPVATKLLVPPDADITANMTLHVIAAKIGATAEDLPKFTVTAYNNVVGALYDADADFGGDTDAMTNAATKTIQHVTLTLALANLAAYPALMELTMKPKGGTLGTDDLIMFGAFIAYKKKLLTA